MTDDLQGRPADPSDLSDPSDLPDPSDRAGAPGSTGAPEVAGTSGADRAAQVAASPAAASSDLPGTDSLVRLQRRLSDFAAARHWQPYHTPKNLAAALSVEAAELLEIFQWLTPEQAGAVMGKPERAARVRDEVADVLAYLLQFCTVVGVDPAAALAAKIERNELRFPVPGGAPEPD